MESDKHKGVKFYEQVNKMFSEFEKVESGMENTPYEEFFKVLNSKSKEVEELKLTHSQI
jgi:hypothetical protein